MLPNSPSIVCSLQPCPERSGKSPSKCKRNELTCQSLLDFDSQKNLRNFVLSSHFNQSIEVPDLSDSNSVSDTSDFPVTPTKPESSLFPTSSEYLNQDVFSELSDSRVNSPISLCSELIHLVSDQENFERANSIFEIPELIYKIIYFAELQALEEKVAQKNQRPICKAILRSIESGVLSSCLLVNKLFHSITKEIMGQRLRFQNQVYLEKLASCDSNILRGIRPMSLELEKIYYAKQQTLDRIAESIDLSRLKVLSLFLCPHLTPTLAFFTSSLISLTIAGSRVLDDLLLHNIAQSCPWLATLDIRACESVTDAGIYSVAMNCKHLAAINLGRKRKGHLITDHSVAHLVKNNSSLETVGLAGCSVTDITIWELAINCGSTLRRLAINGCTGVSDNSISQILRHGLVPELCVFEIKDMPQLKSYRLIINFKRHQAIKGIVMWIEANEHTKIRLKECERKVDILISELVHQDLLDWVNASDNDASYSEFLTMRASA